MCIWVLSFYHVSGFSSHSLEKGWSAWRETLQQYACLGQAGQKHLHFGWEELSVCKRRVEQENITAERDHKLPLTVITQEVIRVSKADLHVSCKALSPFMPLSCDRPHEECLEAAPYHIYYFVRAKWWPDIQTDFPN